MKLEIIEGRFVEDERVMIKINDKRITRKVYYSTEAGDLYIVYNNNKYFYYEFIREED